MWLALLTSMVLTQAPEALVKQSSDVPLVPFYVPRSVRLGVFVNSPMVTPHFRVQWEGVLIDQARNKFVWVISVGSGIGANPPGIMTAHYQHVALGGIGYRGDFGKVAWGFQAALGGVWYRAFFVPGRGQGEEDRVLGYAEGHLHLGYRFLEHLRIGLYGGYASPFAFAIGRPGNTYVGGIDLGLFVDWR